MRDKKKVRFIYIIVRLLLFGVVILFIHKNITENFEKIKGIDFGNYDPKFVFLSVVTVFISLIYPVFVWKFLIRSLGDRINTLPALKIWFVSNLGRYIPGKVFQIAGLVYFSASEGISKSKAIQSVLYSQITANGLGLLMGLSLLFFKNSYIGGISIFHILIILTGVLLAILWMPSFFIRLSNYVLRKFNKQTLDQTLTKSNYIIFIILQILNWMLMSVTFIFMANSYTKLSVIENPEVLLILPISWTLGLIAVFAPGGIGVREGAMSFWLSDFMPLQYALVLPWMHRIIVTIPEIILTVIFYVSYKKPEIYKKQIEQN